MNNFSLTRVLLFIIVLCFFLYGYNVILVRYGLVPYILFITILVTLVALAEIMYYKDKSRPSVRTAQDYTGFDLFLIITFLISTPIIITSIINR